MSKLIGFNKPNNNIEAPAICNHIRSEVQSAIEEGEKSLEEDWTNIEKEPCNNCKGSGYDLEDRMTCIACDGTGTDYEFHYGVVDGVVYARVVQNGIEAFLEYCKTRREEETNEWKKDYALGLSAFAIPNSVRCELVAQGYPVDDWEKAGDMRSFARAVQKHYPLFMTTNVII